MDAATWALIATSFGASFVEMVEAVTIVMAMGYTRGWRSAFTGVATALALLAVVTSIAGYALGRWFPASLMQFVIGGLLLIFGLQWLRKAILRSSGLKAVHDEEAIYRDEVEAAKAAGESRGQLDMFAFMVSFKGVFLEGLEVVFIVITFGLNAGDVPAAGLGAVIAAIVVLSLAVIVRKPLAMIDENALKYGVGLLLASFGTYWAVEGVGVFRAGRAPLEWPGGDLAILALLVLWLLLSRVFVLVLRRPPGAASGRAVSEEAG
ncbi:hypothetical protein [Streptomyces sp. NPDC086777]|uniref:COG4280 domain-containing protein n=1 Tax=Streptomyces sp. NPDC086777 TaxID=3154866 RepID=UPI0034505AD3